MANVFKNETARATIAGATMYTVDAGKTTVVIGLNLANNSVQTQQVSVQVAPSNFYLLKDAPIPAGSALSALDGKLILEAGDSLVIYGDNDNQVDGFLSILEQS